MKMQALGCSFFVKIARHDLRRDPAKLGGVLRSHVASDKGEFALRARVDKRMRVENAACHKNCISKACGIKKTQRVSYIASGASIPRRFNASLMVFFVR